MTLDNQEPKIDQLITIPADPADTGAVREVESEINDGVFAVTELSCSRLLQVLQNFSLRNDIEPARYRKIAEVYVDLATTTYASIAIDDDLLLQFPDLQNRLVQIVIDSIDSNKSHTFDEFCIVLYATLKQEEMHLKLWNYYIEQDLPKLFNKELPELVNLVGSTLAFKYRDIVAAN